MPHVANREDARHAGLQIIGLSIELPGLTDGVVTPKVRPRDDIALLVADDPYLDRPFGVRHAAEQSRRHHELGPPRGAADRRKAAKKKPRTGGAGLL